MLSSLSCSWRFIRGCPVRGLAFGFWRNTFTKLHETERFGTRRYIGQSSRATVATQLPRDFYLERYFAKYEFSAPYLLSCTDVEPLMMCDLLAQADPECRDIWDNLKLAYTESTGHPLLREEVAKLHGMTADETLVVVPQEGIYMAMKCVITYLKRRFSLNKIGVVSMFPAYQSLYENAATLGCDVQHWSVQIDTNNGWSFALDDLKMKVTEDTKLLVVNFPHNPTGFVPDLSFWDEIVHFCKSREIFLFSDEIYRFSNNDGSKALPSACSLYDNAISLSGLSKTFALPGLRMGWLCTQNKEIMKMMQSFKDYLTICAAAPSEILAIIALRNHQAIINRTVRITKSNLDILDKFFNEHCDIFEWHRPKAGTAGFVELKGWALDKGRGSASGFCEKLVEETGVMIIPAKCFEFPDHFIRIGFGYKNMPEVLGHFRKFLNAHKPEF